MNKPNKRQPGWKTIVLTGQILWAATHWACAQSTFTTASGSSLSWATTTNWTPNGVPSGTDVAVIFGSLAGTQSVVLGAARTVGSLTIHDTNANAESLSAASGYTLTLSASNGTATGLVDGSGTAVETVATALVLSSSFDLTVNDTAVTSSASGAITLTGNMTGAGGFIKDGDGTTSMTTATKTYTGATTINAGILRLTQTGEPTGTSSTTVNSGGQLRFDTDKGAYTLGSATTTLVLNGTGDPNLTGTTITSNGAGALAYTGSGAGSLSNPVQLATTASISTSTSGSTLTLQGVVSGLGGLTKVGGSTLALGVANTYSGGTVVSAGTLLANGGTSGTSSATGTGAITINAGTLGGTGAISGAVTVTSGAILQGGAGTVSGALTLVTVPTLNAGSILQLTLDGSLNHSTLALPAGSNPFNANQAFNFTGTPVDGTYASIITGVATGINTSGWIANNGFNSYSFADNGGNIDLTITDVPEPATCLGGALLVGAAAWAQRRRFRGLGPARGSFPRPV